MNPKDATILIVDDEPDLREAIAFDFKRKGFNVLTAGSGNEAFETLSAQLVHVVLSDVRMPDGDGVELLTKIKEKNAFLPVVMFITGYADLSLEEAYDKGADAVFAKPFDRKALYTAVMRALEPMDERFKRKESRIVSDLPIKLKFINSELSVDARVLNIGRGGMFVELSCPVPELTEKVEFNLETAHDPIFKISGQGLVRWVRLKANNNFPAGCGVEILELDDNCIGRVIELINYLKTKSYIPRR